MIFYFFPWYFLAVLGAASELLLIVISASRPAPVCVDGVVKPLQFDRDAFV